MVDREMAKKCEKGERAKRGGGEKEKIRGKWWGGKDG
jgi:hypothetical protein